LWSRTPRKATRSPRCPHRTLPDPLQVSTLKSQLSRLNSQRSL